jgi:hypothetical protein
MGQTILDMIRLRVHTGDLDGARLALVDLLKAEPDNLDAWAFLAMLLKEPDEQAECYRQILRIDPENRQAAMWLEVLTPPAVEPAVEQRPSVAEPQGPEPSLDGESLSDMLFDDLVPSSIPSLVGPGVRPTRPRHLSPSEILELAGGPLAPEERRQCPSCLAVVPRTENKCPWCSAPLPAIDDE